MDPNATLREILEVAKEILNHNESVYSPDAECLASLNLSLHRWIMSGGALPELWTRKELHDG